MAGLHIRAIAEGGESGKFFTFEELEGGAASGGDVADFLGEAELLDRRGGVAATDDADAGGVGEGLSDALGAGLEGGHFENAHRAIPDDGACAEDDFAEGGDGLGANVGAKLVVGELIGRNYGRGRGFGELGGGDDIDGEGDLVTMLGENGLGVLEVGLIEQRLADLISLGFEEGERHTAADDELVDARKEGIDDGDLVFDLCASEDSDEGALGVFDGAA